ncbi:phage head closure protein [Ruminococcus sp.]|uniref:phage head closure protein n=1 Tax=Ruminococcus sp. TaxID=41978 RepID=UPI0025E72D14|nr:phage head closure protein [Ruminococcus sp.]MBQ6250171.1 phage head closure protein [Ruminococcus sp.]
MAYTKKIEIQHYTESQDEIGNDGMLWAVLIRAWAKIEENASGKEYYEAAQTNSENDVVFKIRYTKALENKLTSELRISYRGALYDIKSIGGLAERAPELTIRTVLLNGGVR